MGSFLSKEIENGVRVIPCQNSEISELESCRLLRGSSDKLNQVSLFLSLLFHRQVCDFNSKTFVMQKSLDQFISPFLCVFMIVGVLSRDIGNRSECEFFAVFFGPLRSQRLQLKFETLALSSWEGDAPFPRFLFCLRKNIDRNTNE